jgi:hypothetical protein
MRITIDVTPLKSTLWILGLVGFLWVPGYAEFHPSQRAGDDWYGPYLFYAGSLLLLGLIVESVWRRFKRPQAPTNPVSTST